MFVETRASLAEFRDVFVVWRAPVVEAGARVAAGRASNGQGAVGMLAMQGAVPVGADSSVGLRPERAVVEELHSRLGIAAEATRVGDESRGTSRAGAWALRHAPCVARRCCRGVYARRPQAEKHSGPADVRETQRSKCP